MNFLFSKPGAVADGLTMAAPGYEKGNRVLLQHWLLLARHALVKFVFTSFASGHHPDR
jgi:hypothetical protein